MSHMRETATPRRARCTWRPAEGAGRYRVRARLSAGRSLLFLQGKAQRRVTVGGVAAAGAGAVTVEALRGDGLAGRAVSVRLRPRARKGR